MGFLKKLKSLRFHYKECYYIYTKRCSVQAITMHVHNTQLS